ncbi:excinuclease ABC subunit UvrC [Desulfomicrobium baculatum]|uniref:UvrABC system protein C n=1 Tax=Desulfomicrobium baculatum (strain DSM 4028 / VKM B-1378 / X) TaxID=525897 RepID=C7LTD0_DESBD|nr:excinuclease ABC subunit UvrC [Desulfomicrobium baculatum]ACU89487.1 excinuclease ABC, C subunit [Desulfomicrobium baculatum DSM 4028]
MISRKILPSFPTCPGVYLMKNATGRIIYVGKAKHLRRRLASYFQPEHRLAPKVRVMMTRVETIDFLCTSTEKEALLLEASLIKKHRPKYNIVLRDDKQYVLFCLSRNHPFPALRLTRKVLRDGSVYFGPFTSALSARETKRVIDRLFPLRKCRDTVFSNRTRPCLQYHIGRCLGPCCLPVSEEEYRQVVRRVELFLSGKSDELMAGLHDQMMRLSDALDFEGAARLRDSIRALRETVERQAAVLSDGRDLDVIGVHGHENGAALAIVFVRQGRIIDGQAFWFADAAVDTPEAEAGLTDSFLMQYYNAERFIPARIITAFGSQDPALEDALADMRGGRASVAKARGDQERRLVDIATANAKAHALRQRRTIPTRAELAGVLGVEGEVERIECVDASHIQGEGMRVGMVVFVDGREEKSAYRVYSFPELEGTADDYLALASFAARRAKSGPPWPDLLLIDGGKGQLGAVERAMAENGLSAVPLASIAKGVSRRAGELGDVIFRPGRKNPLNLRPGSPELLFLQHVRDTAHRFVISRLRRHKRAAQLSSDLDNLPGIGPKTARLLWDHFDSVQAMTQARIEDLAALPGFGPKKAAALHAALKTLPGND